MPLKERYSAKTPPQNGEFRSYRSLSDLMLETRCEVGNTDISTLQLKKTTVLVSHLISNGLQESSHG